MSYDDWQSCPICGGDALKTLVDLHAAECHEATVILTDLIAELREGHPQFGDRLPLWGRLAVNRAEQRLRELDTPPNSANEHTNLGGAG